MLGGYIIVKVGGFGLVCVGSWADGAPAGRRRTIISEGLELGEGEGCVADYAFWEGGRVARHAGQEGQC
jgi:hypothetical protein